MIYHFTSPHRSIEFALAINWRQLKEKAKNLLPRIRRSLPTGIVAACTVASCVPGVAAVAGTIGLIAGAIGVAQITEEIYSYA